jgi:hypothetical protein
MGNGFFKWEWKIHYMDNGLEMKRHIDCNWLIEKAEGVYCCCDTRSPNKGKELTIEEALQESCLFFHFKKDKPQTAF